MTKVTLSNVDEGTFGAPKRMHEIVGAVRDGQRNASRNPRFHAVDCLVIPHQHGAELDCIMQDERHFRCAVRESNAFAQAIPLGKILVIHSYWQLRYFSARIFAWVIDSTYRGASPIVHELRCEARLKAVGVAQEAPNRAKHGLLITMIAAAHAPFSSSEIAVYPPAQSWFAPSAGVPAATGRLAHMHAGSLITSNNASLRTPLRGQPCATAISTDDRV